MPNPELLALVDALREGGRHTPALKGADTLRRLVIADWWEENGDPARAEYIRLAVRFHDDDLGKVPARERRDILWREHQARWSHGLEGAGLWYGTWLTHSLGFVTSVTCPLDAWLTAGPALVAENPVALFRRGNWLFEPTSAYHPIAECPPAWAARVTALLTGRTLTWAEAEGADPDLRGRHVSAHLRTIQRAVSRAAIDWALWVAHGRPTEGEFA